jgi:hypothetical protein
MNRLAATALARDLSHPGFAGAEIHGQAVQLDPLGAAWFADLKLLCVSDLHLEKGAAFARRGQMLPPYDTAATLRLLSSVLLRYNPDIVVSLGDNFHDRRGASEMPDIYREVISDLARGREWIWINGNHDPDGVAGLPGLSTDQLSYGRLTFRHEPQKNGAEGEISGHLHPAAILRRREKAVRRPCFAVDGKRMIMPSFGVMTGGLSISHPAFRGLFDIGKLTAHMIGRDRIYSLPYVSL